VPPLGGPEKVEFAKEPMHEAATVALRAGRRHKTLQGTDRSHICTPDLTQVANQQGRPFQARRANKRPLVRKSSVRTSAANLEPYIFGEGELSREGLAFKEWWP
jgi:hypothetical protein